jgi:hypothetical protein
MTARYLDRVRTHEQDSYGSMLNAYKRENRLKATRSSGEEREIASNRGMAVVDSVT